MSSVWAVDNQGFDLQEGDLWYHGAISRQEAEAVLQFHGSTEGLFLIRDSGSILGDFVLSVVHDKKVIHYQIKRHGKKDSLFSLAGQSRVIHGLDELVVYYRHCLKSGLQHSLNDFVVGQSPPVEALLNGTENLLHRASSNGEITVVTELLKSGYRNLSAKNHDGQTALHLASFYGHVDVLHELINYDVAVNVADCSGYSPLHCACQANRPECIKTLLVDGKADPTFVNPITGWVPIHEAAWKGFQDSVTVLLGHHSPALPRTPKNETPCDLARVAGHVDLAEYISNFELPRPTSLLREWYHPEADREDAIRSLKAYDNSADGTFLIRNSNKRKNTLVLSLCFDKKYHHFEIGKKGIYYFLANGPYFPSLEYLVSHYGRFPNGLPTTLIIPVPPSITHKSLESVIPNLSQKLDKGNIRPSRIKLLDVIGEGEFGLVHEGIFKNDVGIRTPVAIKVLNNIGSETKDFLREATIMMGLNHSRIVNLIGVCSGPPVLMVLELVPLGSLLTYLKKHKESIRPDMEIELWAAQVCCGMIYLESQKFIHRDLAARNILLASKYEVKISDFGLSRIINADKDYYTASTGGKWPLKWYAPECYHYGTFSTATDVWSFGVLLWEMYTFGVTPYENMTGAQAMKYVEEGNRLPRPDNVTDNVYEIMNRCWMIDVKLRPSFNELKTFFSSSTKYANIREFIAI